MGKCGWNEKFNFPHKIKINENLSLNFSFFIFLSELYWYFLQKLYHEFLTSSELWLYLKALLDFQEYVVHCIVTGRWKSGQKSVQFWKGQKFYWKVKKTQFSTYFASLRLPRTSQALEPPNSCLSRSIIGCKGRCRRRSIYGRCWWFLTAFRCWVALQAACQRSHYCQRCSSDTRSDERRRVPSRQRRIVDLTWEWWLDGFSEILVPPM